MKFYSMFLLLFLALSCSPNEDKKTVECKAVPIEDCSCLQVFDPVCGCDNVTYPNSCYAECATILNYTKGECP